MRIIDQLVVKLEPVTYGPYQTTFLRIQVRYAGREYNWQWQEDEDHMISMLHRLMMAAEELILKTILQEEQDAKSKQSDSDRSPR